MSEGNSYPRMPESNWWAIRAQFRKSLPTNVTGSYLKSLLSLTSDKAASNLLSPLKQMKLIDEEGKPTDRANEWRDDNKYSSVCQQIVKESYPQELLDLYPGPEFDKEKIAQWFMTTAKLGDGAAKIIASMFILLNGKEIKTEALNGSNTTPPKKGVKSSPLKKPTEHITKSLNTPKENNNSKEAFPTNQDRLSPTIHIDLQIHISPDASNEQIDNIFASIAKHLKP